MVSGQFKGQNKPFKALFKKVYLWAAVNTSAYFGSLLCIRDKACDSRVLLLASMTPEVPGDSDTLYWEDVSGNSDASCLCGNNTRSCSSMMQRKYEITCMSRERRRQTHHNIGNCLLQIISLQMVF